MSRAERVVALGGCIVPETPVNRQCSGGHTWWHSRRRPTVVVPPPDALWPDIWRFALSYNAYSDQRGFPEAAEVANAAARRWSADGSLPDDLSTARAALFFEQRRYHHFGWDPEGDDARYVRALLAQIGDLSDGVVRLLTGTERPNHEDLDDPGVDQNGPPASEAGAAAPPVSSVRPQGQRRGPIGPSDDHREGTRNAMGGPYEWTSGRMLHLKGCSHFEEHIPPRRATGEEMRSLPVCNDCAREYGTSGNGPPGAGNSNPQELTFRCPRCFTLKPITLQMEDGVCSDCE